MGNEERWARKNGTKHTKNRGTRLTRSGALKSGTWPMKSMSLMKRDTPSYGEFLMNIFAPTLEASTTLLSAT